MRICEKIRGYRFGGSLFLHYRKDLVALTCESSFL